MSRLLAIILVLPCVVMGQVYIPDPGLKAAIEQALGKTNPTQTDMLALTQLSAGSRQIADLTGLEYATNLVSLYLASNRITDITPLAGLVGLYELDLSRNQISDIGPIAGLTGLQSLDLDYNRIADLTALSGLTGLTRLDLDSNMIWDLAPLEGLTGLEELWLCSNRLSAIDSIADLVYLRRLDLESNFIADISPLGGLTLLESLWLGSNYITDISALAGLKSLATLGLESNMLTDISPLSRMGAMEVLDLGGNQIQDLWPLSGLGSLWYLDIHGNAVTSLEPICTLSGLTTLDIGDNPLDGQACQVHIPQILANNPGLDLRGNPCQDQVSLEVTSGLGGSIVRPGHGTFSYEPGQVVVVEAVPSAGYRFSHWSGSIGSGENPLVFTLDYDAHLRANFVSCLKQIHVDANAMDKEPNGSALRPFSRIQQAIEVADAGATVLVRPGLYVESLDLLGKEISVLGGDPNDQTCQQWPVVTGDGTGPAIRFTRGETSRCVLSGLMIAGNTAAPVCAVWCISSSPTIRHCLIVGNRAGADGGSVIRCDHSGAEFLHCTIADNQAGPSGGCILLVDSQVRMSHCILWANSPRQLIVQGQGDPVISFCDIAGGWTGPGNIDVDPLFVRHGHWQADTQVWVHGDYHLRSEWGRWDPGACIWVCDQVSSPCIDAGDPNAAVGFEPQPHGGRINIGAYGGTTQASRSRPDDIHVAFGHPVLKAMVEWELQILDPTVKDMLALTQLLCFNNAISDLKGLEYALNLHTLQLRMQRITEVTSLSGLGQLVSLDLSRNQITSVAPLAGLRRLRWLNLHDNQIVTIPALGGLSLLEELDIHDNRIGDLSPLLALRALRRLVILGNPLHPIACQVHIPQVEANNPGIDIWYDPYAQCGKAAFQGAPHDHGPEGLI